jgi:LytS/YehU family sensor histidine kinase
MVMVVVTAADVVVFHYIYRTPLDVDILGKSIALGIMLTLMMNTLYESVYFSQKWKSAFIKAEVLRRENLQSHFANLKNQVSPHFLFNSLNTLTTLIEENKSLAKQFTIELSRVYQYVLESRDWKLVELRKEMDFTCTYIFLQNIRFGNALKLDVNLDEATLNTWVPPLTIQMLVENAVKHNVISATRPLLIEIGRKKDHIFIRNNLQKKNRIETSTGIGLQNIGNRYNYFGAGNVNIIETQDEFRVEIPVVEKGEG